MQEWIDILQKNKLGEVLLNEPLSKHTTWKVGGPADALVIINTKKELQMVLAVLKQFDVLWKVLGKGSNLLVQDKGYRGAILKLGTEFQDISFNETSIKVGSGFPLIRLANLAAKRGLTGLEFAGGIPGTVGGAVFMNAGAHGSDIAHVLQEAEILLANGEIEIWDTNNFAFQYRTSALQQKKAIILHAIFRLQEGNRKKIADDMANFKSRRSSSQPYHLPNAGSVFRNPENNYAGRLIEELGLKGYQIGGAQISTLHANFIVNVGNATAKDILTLISFVKEKVKEEYNISLRTEIEVVGEG